MLFIVSFRERYGIVLRDYFLLHFIRFTEKSLASIADAHNLAAVYGAKTAIDDKSKVFL